MPATRVYPKALSQYVVTPSNSYMLIYLSIYTNYNTTSGIYDNAESKEYYFPFTYGGTSVKADWNNSKMIYFEVTNASMSFSISEGEYFDINTGDILNIQEFANLVYAALGIGA